MVGEEWCGGWCVNAPLGSCLGSGGVCELRVWQEVASGIGLDRMGSDRMGSDGGKFGMCGVSGAVLDVCGGQG